MEHRTEQGRGGQLAEIHVYRGQAAPYREPHLASATEAQASEWSRDHRVVMHRRPLRYPRDWPNKPAREKGVDVMLACDLVRHALERRAQTLILASRDTDLVPALEMVRDLGSGITIEVTTWENCSRLRFPDRSHLWCTYLSGAHFVRCRDRKPY